MFDSLVGPGNPCPEDQLEPVFIQSLYWSLGAGLEDADRTRFNDLMRDCGSLPGLADDGERRAKGGEICNDVLFIRFYMFF